MKKLFSLLIFFLFGILLSGCPGGSVTYYTIESVNVLLFSFDKYGNYPHLDEFNKYEIGIGIFADSLTEKVEIAQAAGFGNKAYAMENPNEIVYTNTIDSLNVFTLYNFDAEHPANSSVNDILQSLDYMGETHQVNINDLSDIDIFLKFSGIPQNDTLRFRITGRITGKGSFSEKTQFVILK
jgi:hypothetical protein